MSAQALRAGFGEPKLDLGDAFDGKGILFTGTTGFLGKVALSMLLHRYGQRLGRVYVLVRKGSGLSAVDRFRDKVALAEPFQPLRDELGDEDALRFILGRCTVIDGDITHARFGMDEASVEALKGKIHAVVNCAGLVSFTPSLEVGLRVNTRGVEHAVALCKELGAPLLHISTAFVAGNRSGLVFEDEELSGYFPRRDELGTSDFSLRQELADADRIVARLREQADDHALTSMFRKKAMERLDEEGRDASDARAMRLAVGRERKFWLTGELLRAGMDRAAHWGWPNTYTYTKSLGEQVLAEAEGLDWTILRPSVVESAVAYPFPGWNEGFNTSAPLAYAGIQGHRTVPASPNAILDIIPVDHVAAAVIAATGDAIVRKGRRVLQLASGDINPFAAPRVVELVGLYRRRHFRKRESGSKLLNELKSRVEPQAVARATFDRRSAPRLHQGASWLKKVIDARRPSWGAPRVNALLDRAKERLTEVEGQTQSVEMLVDLFTPFLWDNRFIFRCDNTRALYARLSDADRAAVPWAPESIDWRRYFLEVHLPGLERWTFPELERETEKRRVVSAHRDLVELFASSVHAHRHRVAFRMASGDSEERFTFSEVDRYSARVASSLLARGVGKGDRVLLASENRPEWAIAYFGILRSGATAVPVDPELTQAELLNLARRSAARVCLLSEDVVARLPELPAALSTPASSRPNTSGSASAGADASKFGASAGAGTSANGNEAVTPHALSLADAMSGDPSQPDGIAELPRKASPDDVASLIFTSGTTGTPKGVMLTHRNFASLVAKVAGVFDLGTGDGVLSVLPLHHTFEFTCGFLMPFSRGAEVTYIDELNTDRLGEVLETGRVTAMVGVPALWQLLHRRMTQEIAAKPAVVEQGVKALLAAHGELRNRTSLNLGKLLFWPVHRKLGGRMRFLVSGGSALSDDVREAFHQLGFDLAEGYGLTEAAPVLAVSEIENGLRKGSLGRALPGIELRIADPDANGVGEVLAKGPNVMAGYFQDQAATDAVLVDGWLRTGDLGRLDADGRLTLVGRQKDVIIDANGKNVYPDELEEAYRHNDAIKELSVVGLPHEGDGERVACLCVPEYGDRPREEVRRELEAHFRKVSSELPFYRRIKLLRFSDKELEKTSTRKVKRPAVVSELTRMERIERSGDKARESQRQGANAGEDAARAWLYPLLAEVTQRPIAGLRPETELVAELGVDSLMTTELSVALERAGLSRAALGELASIGTVADLQRLVERTGRRPAAELRAKELPTSEAERDAQKEIDVPEPLAAAGRALLGYGQRFLYERVFDLDVVGRSFVPQNQSFLVVANHSSHLDMGLVKVALGDQGERLTVLAARDYFFDTPLKRAYFENFTNLLPMERKGSLRESLRVAGEALHQGYNVLIFPEGTRSPDGVLMPFKPTLGYLALTHKVDVLPLYLAGAYEALPKGGVVPKAKKLQVRIGPLLPWRSLATHATGRTKSDRYRAATARVEQAVRALADGRVMSAGSDETPSTSPSTPDPATSSTSGGPPASSPSSPGPAGDVRTGGSR